MYDFLIKHVSLCGRRRTLTEASALGYSDILHMHASAAYNSAQRFISRNISNADLYVKVGWPSGSL